MFHNRMNKYRFLTQEVSEIAYKYIYYIKIVSFKKIIFINIFFFCFANEKAILNKIYIYLF